MLGKKANCIIDNIKAQKVVSLPVPLYKSQKGQYFVGQTDPLWASSSSFAWAGLINPFNSSMNLYENVFTISNFSDDYLTAEIWLNTNLPENLKVSHKVSSTNTAIKPLPTNKVEIKFIESTTEPPLQGVNIFERIIPPNTTLVSEDDGKFIEGPMGNFMLIIKSSSQSLHKAVVAFGWWEEPRR